MLSHNFRFLPTEDLERMFLDQTKNFIDAVTFHLPLYHLEHLKFDLDLLWEELKMRNRLFCEVFNQISQF